MRLILEEQQKCLQSFIHNATYHPMNPNAHVTYQTVNLFSSDKCFICFISDYPYYIWWNIITIPKYKHIAPHVLSTSAELYRQCCDVPGTMVKIDVLDTCGAMICRYFGIAFLLLFKKLPNVFVKSFQDWLNSVQ